MSGWVGWSTSQHSPTTVALLLPAGVNNDALARVPRCCWVGGSTSQHSPTSVALLLPAGVNNDALARVSRCCWVGGSTSQHSPTSVALLLPAGVNNDALARVPRCCWAEWSTSQHSPTSVALLLPRGRRESPDTTEAGACSQTPASLIAYQLPAASTGGTSGVVPASAPVKVNTALVPSPSASTRTICPGRSSPNRIFSLSASSMSR